jgi:hypothetical protein
LYSYSLKNLNTTKNYRCSDTAEITYGIPEAMWYVDVGSCTGVWDIPYVYDGGLCTWDWATTFYVNTLTGNRVATIGAGTSISLDSLDKNTEYILASSSGAYQANLKFGYPPNPGSSNNSETNTWIIFGTNSPGNYFTCCEEDNRLWSTLSDANWVVRLGSETVLSPLSDVFKEGYSSYVNLSELNKTSVYSIVDTDIGNTYTLVYRDPVNISNYSLSSVYDPNIETIDVRCDASASAVEVDYYLLEGSSQDLGDAIQVSSRIAQSGNYFQTFYYGDDFTSSVTAVVAVCWRDGIVDAVLICDTSR